MKFIAMLFGLLLAFNSAFATPVYHELALMDLDQMSALVKRKLKESRDASGDLAPLRDAVRVVFSRPDEDGMIDKIMGPLRLEIDDLDKWENVLEELANVSLSTLKDPKGLSAAEQVTQVIFLQNVIAHFKPQAKGPGTPHSVLERIRDADLKLSKEMRHERKLRMMKDSASPSEMAAQVLNPEKK